MELIDQDGTRVVYTPGFIENPDKMYETIMRYVTKNDDHQLVQNTFMLAGKVCTFHYLSLTPAFGDLGVKCRTYSSEFGCQGWPLFLIKIREKLQTIYSQKFNCCAMNLYRDGNDYIGPHGDRNDNLVPNSTIASISLGAERDFVLKHNQTKETTKIKLENGSLITMEGTCQDVFKHSLPIRKRVKTPRINLTFRWVVEE